MAVDNLFLGTARKSVGDVTFYTRNGKQVSRKRVRKISNPKSLAQAVRRATFAPAAKFYSPLAGVLEQSFEGLSKSESYTAFLKQAVRDCAAGGWYVSKDEGFFPMPFMLSRGTLRPVNYAMQETEGSFIILGTADSSFADIDTSTVGGLSQIFTKLGYTAGQQVTMIFIKWVEGVGYYPVYYRFIIAEDSTVESPLVEVGVTYVNDVGITVVTNDNYQIEAGAIIVSSYENNKWRRSTQRLSVAEEIMATITSVEAYEAATGSYRQSQSEVTSDVYLNGSTGGGSPTAAVIALDDGRVFRPQTISYTNGFGWVNGIVGTATTTFAYVKIGDQILLSPSTKGAAPSGATLPRHWLDGSNPLVQEWLQSTGVDPSVF